MMASVCGKTPGSHSDAYTVFAWLCQKTTATGFSFSTTRFKVFASGSEKASVPALTTLLRQVLSGFHLQSKLKPESTWRSKVVSAGTEALTTLLRQVLSGFHLQSKLRLRSTSFALKRPRPVV